MAIGTHNDIVIYNAQYQAGMTEVIMQEVDAFNQASAGALVLEANQLIGHYDHHAFFTEVNGLVTRRDINSTAAAAEQGLSQDEEVGVKLNRKIGPINHTIASLKNQGMSVDTLSYVMGQQAGKGKAQDMLNTAIRSAVSANTGNAAMVHTIATSLRHEDTTYALQKYGDKMQAVSAVIMHSAKFYDLYRDGMHNFKIDAVAGVQIATGIIGTMGRTYVVTDCPDLIDTATNQFRTLFVQQGGLLVTESETPTLLIETVGGNESISMRYQYEYAYNVRAKGYKWDVANGGINPTDATLGTAANWIKVATDNKSVASSMLVSL